MIPAAESLINTTARWAFFFCILLILNACSDDEPVDSAEEQESGNSSEEEVLHVREWYPSPKYLQQRQIMVAPAQQQAPTHVIQPGQYHPSTIPQTWNAGQATYQQPPVQQPMQQDGVTQYWQPQVQQTIQAQPATPGAYYQYGTPPQNVQRPWGIVPESRQHGHPGGYNIWQPSGQLQQGFAVPENTNPAWGTTVPYGAAPGYGPGYIW
jgi:hypothetical protein